MINQYTNNMFFNGNTFGIVVFLVFIVTLLRVKKLSRNQATKIIDILLFEDSK